MIGEFYSKGCHKYATQKIKYNDKEFYFVRYGHGKKFGCFVYDGNNRIGASIKNNITYNNNDTYEIYILKGY